MNAMALKCKSLVLLFYATYYLPHTPAEYTALEKVFLKKSTFPRIWDHGVGSASIYCGLKLLFNELIIWASDKFTWESAIQYQWVTFHSEAIFKLGISSCKLKLGCVQTFPVTMVTHPLPQCTEVEKWSKLPPVVSLLFTLYITHTRM